MLLDDQHLLLESHKHQAAARGHDSELALWQVSPRHVLLESHSMMLDRVHLGVESMLLLEQTTHSLEIQLLLLEIERLVLESRQQWLEIQLQSLASLFESFLIVDESKANQYRAPSKRESINQERLGELVSERSNLE